MTGVIIRVRLTPRGGKDAVIGVRDGVLHLRVAAPAADGAANRACAALVAGRLAALPLLGG
jgi:uncharacterized protein